MAKGPPPPEPPAPPPPSRKPSGPITYTIEKGADVFNWRDIAGFLVLVAVAIASVFLMKWLRG